MHVGRELVRPGTPSFQFNCAPGLPLEICNASFLASTANRTQGRTKLGALKDLNYVQAILTLNFLVAMVNTLNTKTHSSKTKKAEFSFQSAHVKSSCYCKQRMKSKLSLPLECVETKLCKPHLTPTQLVWNGVV